MASVTCWNRSVATDPFERMTIRKRLLLLLLPALAALLGLWAWSAYRSVLRFADIAYDRALYDTARTLATQVKAQNGKAILDLSEDEREMLEVDPQDDVYFEVFSAEGARLGGTANLPAPAASSAPGDFGYLYDGEFLNQSLRLVQYVPSATEPFQFVVRIGETRRKRNRLATEATLAMVPMQIVFLGTSVLLVWLGVGWGLRPLETLRAAIARRDYADLEPLSLRGLPIELRGQAKAINDLMARLRVVLDTERRFLADATHQLRTPLTVLRTQTELALRANDFESLKPRVRQMAGVCERLTRLANQLLNLSRAEAGLAGVGENGRLDLTHVLEEVLARHEPAAHAKQQTLELFGDGTPLWLRGNLLMLEEMVANLVDNAIRYSPPNTRVAVEARDTGGEVRLTVRDDGPGLSDFERQRVMDRFYRGAGVTEPGSGLGLAIVREIVRAHDGRFELAAARADGTGLLAMIDLPRYRERDARVLSEPATASTTP
jgi:two-component system, OmpR family, sensor histidine kinase TctE